MKPAAVKAAGFTIQAPRLLVYQGPAEVDERFCVSRRRKSRTRLPFATTTYRANKDGVLRPQLPSRCIYATGAQSCCIVVDHFRLRKTGPCFPLAVVGCSAHSPRRYTLYPPGHVPYGREAVAPYNPSGELLVEAASRQPPWEATLFAAALDAAKGEGWPSESLYDRPRRRRTQGRRLERAGRLVGVHPQLKERVREQIATRLSVPTMNLLRGAGGWARSWKTRGLAVLAVLVAIPIQASLQQRMLAAGAAGGLWAQPRHWDADRGSWLTWPLAPCPASKRSEQAVAAAPRARGPPPTKSPGAAAP